MNKLYLEFNTYTQTLRQQPENYLLASVNPDYKHNYSGTWELNPDMAANKQVVLLIAELIFFDHSIKYGDPEKLFEALHNQKYTVYDRTMKYNDSNKLFKALRNQRYTVIVTTIK